MTSTQKQPPFIVNLSRTEHALLPVQGTFATDDDLQAMIGNLQTLPPTEQENERRLHIAWAISLAFERAPKGAEKVLILGSDALRFLDAKERYLVENELKKRFGIRTESLNTRS
ncbi:MAG: hypothetical protein GC134_06025 [Proteobacteria bacterium]|nr:hypothetical protein [Pseudomonadota bacterium]